jgi:hypothetical protein
MSRIAGGDTYVAAPTNNVYTVLLMGAALVQVIGLVILFIFATSQVGGLF